MTIVRLLTTVAGIALAVGAATLSGAAALHAHTPDGAEVHVETVRDGETVGDPITIFVRLTYAIGDRLVLSDLSEPLGALEPAVPELIETLVTNGEDPHTTASIVLRTRAFVTGVLPVELPELTLVDPAGTTTIIVLPPFELEILSVLPTDPALAVLQPLKAAEQIDGAPIALELVLGSIGGSVALVLFAIVMRRYLAQRKLVFPQPPPNPAAIATAELGAIRDAEMLPSRLQDFCRQVDVTVRRFLANRYALPAANLTANELASRLARAGAEPGTIQRVRNLCAETDAVAYAGAVPTAERAARYVELAEAIVKPPHFSELRKGKVTATSATTSSNTTLASKAASSANEPGLEMPPSKDVRPARSDIQGDSFADRWLRPPDRGGT